PDAGAPSAPACWPQSGCAVDGALASELSIDTKTWVVWLRSIPASAEFVVKVIVRPVPALKERPWPEPTWTGSPPASGSIATQSPTGEATCSVELRTQTW